MASNRSRTGAAWQRAHGLSILVLLLSFAIVGVASGCEQSDAAQATSTPSSANSNGVSQKAADGRRHVPPAAVHFAKAIFIKPDGNTPEADARMAPLVVLQCDEANAPVPFCAVVPTETGPPVLDPKRPAVYVFEDEIELNGQTHRRITHLLFYLAGKSDPNANRVAFGCIQTMLDVEGAPMVWQVYDVQHDGRDQAYVSRSIEGAGIREYGTPQPNQTFAVQRPDSNVEVVRILEDGPEPMGPMVYISHPQHAVVSLGCRCMASQVDEIERATFYRLIKNPFAIGPDASALDQIQAFFEACQLRWSPGFETFLSRRLDECLRLPAGV